MNWLMRISFYRRLQAALLLFLILPLLMISWISYRMNKEANEENVRTNMKGIIGILANDLSKTANDVTFTVNQFSSGTQNRLFTNLRFLKDMDSFSGFQQYQTFLSVNEEAKVLIGKLSLAQVSMIYVNQAGFPLVGLQNREEHEALMKREPHFRPMPYAQAVMGVVEWFRVGSKMVDSGSPPGQYDLYIKKSIYDPIHDELIGTLFLRLPYAYFQQLLANAGAGVFSIYEKDQSLLAGMPGSPPVLSNKPGKGWMREYTEVPGTSWTLSYDIEKKAVTGELTQRYSLILSFVLIVLFVFLFISVVLAKGLNRPILKLMKVAKLYGAGNSTVRFPVQGQDEISILGGTINRMMDDINALIRRVETEQEEKRTMELYALYSQIQPHFLLNTLNSIKCNLALEGDQVYSEALDSLMGLLRAHLRVHEPLQLAEECKLLTHYVSIIRMRNRLDIDLRIELPEEYRQIMVPRLLLQPLVENSVVHGFTRTTRTPVITVKAAAAPGGLVIQVEDNGKGMDKARAEELTRKLRSGEEHSGERGIGLFNVIRRLKLSYGDKAWFSVQPKGQDGFVSTLFIPTDERSGEENGDSGHAY